MARLPTFRPVSALQRLTVGLGAAVASFVDPSRADMVALLGELTGGPSLAAIRTRMRASEEGRAILADRPRISAASLAAAGPFSPGSLGEGYTAFLRAHAFSPDERPSTRLIADEELAYIMQRYREVHDLWHVLSGLPPSVLGEAAVKALEAVQTGLPMAALAAAIAPVRLSPAERHAYVSVYLPWAVSTGRACSHLMSVRYEGRLHSSVEEVRAELRFPLAPVMQ
jgi:ubiquinone biosynthesis protein COQ4